MVLKGVKRRTEQGVFYKRLAKRIHTLQTPYRRLNLNFVLCYARAIAYTSV
jgi:hypothetical protein